MDRQTDGLEDRWTRWKQYNPPSTNIVCGGYNDVTGCLKHDTQHYDIVSTLVSEDTRHNAIFPWTCTSELSIARYYLRWLNNCWKQHYNTMNPGLLLIFILNFCTRVSYTLAFQVLTTRSSWLHDLLLNKNLTKGSGTIRPIFGLKIFGKIEILHWLSILLTL